MKYAIEVRWRCCRLRYIFQTAKVWNVPKWKAPTRGRPLRILGPRRTIHYPTKSHRISWATQLQRGKCSSSISIPVRSRPCGQLQAILRSSSLNPSKENSRSSIVSTIDRPLRFFFQLFVSVFVFIIIIIIIFCIIYRSLTLSQRFFQIGHDPLQIICFVWFFVFGRFRILYRPVRILRLAFGWVEIVWMILEWSWDSLRILKAFMLRNYLDEFGMLWESFKFFQDYMRFFFFSPNT